MSKNILDEAIAPETTSKAFDRRKFVTRVGVGGLGAAAISLLGGVINPLQAATITDVDIVNFALNLEYLEAEFYSVASFGATLQQRGIIPSSAVSAPTIGGHMVPNFGASKVAFLAAQLRDDEADHVVFLRKALGAAAVKKPAINLDALGFGFDNTNDFLKLARIFEDVGVSAYLGAAPLIKNATYLDAAARILATEAQHAGAIRVENVIWGVTTPAVDGKDVPPTSHKTFDVDGSALSIPRSTAEVLKIVYGGGSHSGGFYPNGLNGSIK